MAQARPIQAAFTAGILGRSIEGRADLDAYAIGARALRNLLPKVQGYSQTRPGSRFVEELPAGYAARAWGFNFNAEQTYTIVFTADEAGVGPGAIRFYRDGGVLLTAPANTTPYTVASDYTAAELPTLSFVQSADVLYVFCPTKPVRELRRLADSASSTSWQLVDADFADGPYEDQNTSATTLRITSGTPTEGNTIEVTASAALFAASDVGRLVRIRRQSNANNWGYGRITVFDSDTVVDVLVLSDFNSDLTTTPSENWRLGAFSGTTGYPRCGAFFEGRLWLGATASRPQTVFGSVSGDIASFAPSALDGTVSDDSAVTLTLDDDRVNRIEWLLAAAGSLLAGTSGGEFVIRARSAGNADPISPTNAAAFRQTAYGSAASVNALKVGPAALFVQRGSGDGGGAGDARTGGRRLREMLFRFEADQYTADDQTLRCGELLHAAPESAAADNAGGLGLGFSGSGGVIELALATVPATRVWALRADGVLLGYDYETAQGVRAWSDHVLAGSCPDWLGREPGTLADGEPVSAVEAVQQALAGGRVRSMAVIRDDDSAQDQLWMVVERRVNGATVRFVEYLLPEPELSWRAEDAVHLDASISSRGWRLDGVTLSVSVDGAGVATATASASVFASGDVGDLLGLQTDAEAAGPEPGPIRFCRISAFTSGTVVTLGAGHGLAAGTTTLIRRWGNAIETQATGLGHLIGQSVAIVADGGLAGMATVSGAGAVALPAPAMTLHIGLVPAVILRLMPVVAAGENYSSIGRTVNLNGGKLRLLRSGPVEVQAVGVSGGRRVESASTALVPMRDPLEGTQAAQKLQSGWFDIPQTLGPSEDIALEIRPAAPLTMRVQSLALVAEVGS